MAIIVEQSNNLTQPIPLKLQVHLSISLKTLSSCRSLSEYHFAIDLIYFFLVLFVAISLSKVHSEFLHTDSRGIASSFNDTSIHVLSCNAYGYQGQLLNAYSFY